MPGGGSVLNTFLGRSEEERDALARITRQEDRCFELVPGEDQDIAVHVRADLPRHSLLNDRAKLLEATTNRKSDRNMYATIVIGVVIFFKTGITWADLLHFFASL